MVTNSSKRQAEIFGRYLLKIPPSSASKKLFVRIVDRTDFISQQDANLLKFALERPWAISYIDAGLAVLNPDSELRRRLFIMFAILESMPDYYDYFLPKRRSFWYAFYVFFSGLRAALKATVGVVLVKTVG